MEWENNRPGFEIPPHRGAQMNISTEEAFIFMGMSYFIIRLAFSMVSSVEPVEALHKFTYNFFVTKEQAP